MKRSTDRILTTHTGSLPRPQDLIEQLQARDSGQPVDTVAFESRVRESVAEIVRHQAAAGVDIVNDGEQSKIGYSTYVKERLSGFDGEETAPVVMGESADFPNWGTGLQSRLAGYTRPVCNGPIAWKDKSGLFQDPGKSQIRFFGRGCRRSVHDSGVTRSRGQLHGRSILIPS